MESLFQGKPKNSVGFTGCGKMSHRYVQHWGPPAWYSFPQSLVLLGFTVSFDSLSECSVTHSVLNVIDTPEQSWCSGGCHVLKLSCNFAVFGTATVHNDPPALPSYIHCVCVCVETSLLCATTPHAKSSSLHTFVSQWVILTPVPALLAFCDFYST